MWRLPAKKAVSGIVHRENTGLINKRIDQIRGRRAASFNLASRAVVGLNANTARTRGDALDTECTATRGDSVSHDSISSAAGALAIYSVRASGCTPAENRPVLAAYPPTP
jgi:hypothetical protein